MAEFKRNWRVFDRDSANTCRIANLKAGGESATETAQSTYWSFSDMIRTQILNWSKKCWLLRSGLCVETPLQRFGSRLEPDPEPTREFGPIVNTKYQLLVVTREYLSGWAKTQQLELSTFQKVADVIYKAVIGWVRTPEYMVVDERAANRKWTNFLLLKRYNLRKITETPNHAATKKMIEWGYRQIANALCTLMACTDELTEKWIDHQPAVLWRGRITVRFMTGYSHIHLMFGQDALLSIHLQWLTWNTANWIQGINNRVPLPAASAVQPKQWWEDINAAIQNLQESREANKW